MRRLMSLAVLLIGVSCLAGAGTDATVEEIQKEPSRFQGKSLTVNAEVSGTVAEGPKWCRLTVKGGTGMVVSDKMKQDGITFVIPKDQKDALTKGFQDGQFYPAKLTVNVEKSDRGFWLVQVSGLERTDRVGPRGTGKGLATREVGKAAPAGPANGDATSSSPRTESVVAEGVGKTKDEALKDAFRNAVRQVVGALVDAETLVKNDQIISDKVLTYSDGLVTKYEEVGGGQKDGLLRVKIKATVKRAIVAEKLKTAKVAVKEVDGKGMFAEVVTDLEREKNATQLLDKRLKGFPAALVMAEPVGTPRIGRKGETETTIEYDIRLSLDIEKYDAFVKAALPVLSRVARAKGEIQTERDGFQEKMMGGNTFNYKDQSTHHYYIARATFGDRLKDDRSLVNLRPSFVMLFKKEDTPEEACKKEIRGRDVSECDVVIVNTKRTKLNDRLTWAWYVIPILHVPSPAASVNIALVGTGGDEITTNQLRLGKVMVPGLTIPEVSARDRCKVAIISPYMTHGSYYFQSIDVSLTSKVATDDLKKLKTIRCSVVPETIQGR